MKEEKRNSKVTFDVPSARATDWFLGIWERGVTDVQVSWGDDCKVILRGETCRGEGASLPENRVSSVVFERPPVPPGEAGNGQLHHEVRTGDRRLWKWSAGDVMAMDRSMRTAKNQEVILWWPQYLQAPGRKRNLERDRWRVVKKLRGNCRRVVIPKTKDASSWQMP